MILIDCEQGTPEWHAARMGIPTASQFARIMTPAKRGYSSQASGYICELIAELRGVEKDRYTSDAMQHGIDTEAEARAWYAFTRDIDVRQVGFCMTDDGRFGCSPDGLVGDDGGAEIKCPEPKTHVEYLLDGGLPLAYKCQVHGSLFVTGRAWWDFVSYCPPMPELVVRVTPDDFTDALRGALDRFHAEFEAAKKKIEQIGSNHA